MATYDYYKLQQGGIPNVKPGANWFWIRMDYSKQPFEINDKAKVCEVKNHWIIKGGFFRPTVDGAAATSTISLGTTDGGAELDAAADHSTATDTWVRFDTVDDDGPVAITADGYLWVLVETAAAYSGVVDYLIEVIVAPGDEDRVDSIAEAN